VCGCDPFGGTPSPPPAPVSTDLLVAKIGKKKEALKGLGNLHELTLRRKRARALRPQKAIRPLLRKILRGENIRGQNGPAADLKGEHTLKHTPPGREPGTRSCETSTLTASREVTCGGGKSRVPAHGADHLSEISQRVCIAAVPTPEEVHFAPGHKGRLFAGVSRGNRRAQRPPTR